MWVHVRMMREINLVHPHVLSDPLLLYFLVLQLLQKLFLDLLCLRCNQLQFHIFDLLQYEGLIRTEKKQFQRHNGRRGKVLLF